MSLRIYGNRLLKTLPGQDTRPTVARVRQAVFNIWQGNIAGCHWLDLCAGNGTMGAEALCRGAAWVVGIEQSPRTAAILQQNWRAIVQPHQSFQVIRGDVCRQLATLAGQTFDYIYFDPPYASDWYEAVIATIAQERLLSPTGEMAVEHHVQQPPPETIEQLVVCRVKQYGQTGLTFYGWPE